MNNLILNFLSIVSALLLLNTCTTDSSETHNQAKSSGYVLKPDEGTVFPGSDTPMIVKVSPELGSENSITIVKKSGQEKAQDSIITVTQMRYFM